MMNQRKWTREELILAFNLYIKIPFGTITRQNCHIIQLAHLLNRTPNAVAMKLLNFASFDPYHKARGIHGLRHSSRLDQKIYDEFTHHWSDLLFESEQILALKQKTTVEKKYDCLLTDVSDKKGEMKLRQVKTRVNQHLFRKIILSIYSEQCAISKINIPELLIASHIIPWSKNEKERLNPENGICLSPLYDMAFDKGFITIDSEYKIQIASELKSKVHHTCYQTYFESFENQKINLPDKFLPRKDFLDYHLNQCFRG